MTQSNRKLAGIILLLLSIIAWSVVAGTIYAGFLGGAQWWVLIIYFAAAGLTWFFPAAWIIRWMSRPDEPKPRSRPG